MDLFKIVLLTVMAGIVSVANGEETIFREKSNYYDYSLAHFVYTAVDEKSEGTTKEYYETGELKAEVTHKQGKVESKKEFLKNGKLEGETRYLDDKKHETRIEYYSTGELFRERQLIDGRLEGLEKEYYQNGKLKAERNYKNGKRHGNAIGYYSNGNLQGDWQFEAGVPVKATIFFSSGEKWLEHTAFDKEGRLNGVSKEYDKEGNWIAKRYYKDDIMIKRKSVTRWF
ncbi:MAG: hypothetical protein BWK79_00400 [Beggiatoa sp. IS2]|nr:MAG: hypothetical protein BWK79_00400 [Beggiatoa sp. IS2]